MSKIKLGQVFTPRWIVEYMISLSNNLKKDENMSILEPSVGKGAFFNEIPRKDNKLIGIEIDSALARLNSNVENIDFFEYFFENHLKKFDLVIGNPPYIDYKKIDMWTKKWITNSNLYLNNKPNLYQFFLLACMKSLNRRGELIFILPADVLFKTSSKEIVDLIQEEFSITKYRIIKENVWDNASITTAIIKLDKVRNHPEKIDYFIKNSKVFFKMEEPLKINGFVGVKVGGVPKSKQDVICDEEGIDFVHSKTRKTGRTIKYKYDKINWIRPVPVPPIKDNKRIYVNAITRNELPFFTNSSEYYDGSILCIYFESFVNIEMIIRKLNKIKWEEIGLKRNGRLVLSQSILSSLISCNL